MKKVVKLMVVVMMVIAMVACTGKPVKKDAYDAEGTFNIREQSAIEGYRSEDNRLEYPIMQEDL